MTLPRFQDDELGGIVSAHRPDSRSVVVKREGAIAVLGKIALDLQSTLGVEMMA